MVIYIQESRKPGCGVIFFHVILTIITCGLWLGVLLIAYLLRRW